MLTKFDQLVIATRNRGKFVEIARLLRGTEVDLLSLDDFPELPDVLEDGETFEENALKKARFVSTSLGLPALADDSGLCVDALSGRPGVMSARYAGPKADDRLRYIKILEEMREIEDHLRTARFVCAVALVCPGGQEELFRGVCEGLILREPRGVGGFGYDPIFYYEELGRSFGELDLETKNLVSHRGRALKLFADFVLESQESM
ncbi:MAG: XTP/dITP diphosphatase [Pseudomonadota bacterium]